MFININPSLFTSNDAIDAEFETLVQEIYSCGLEPSGIVCEIIETPAVSNTFLDRLCTQLRHAGFKLAVDDYGSDHSNWDRFELLQPDILKLDGPVFRDLCKTPAAGSALRNLTDSLHETGCILLVEGIESRNQFEIAVDAGVSLLQGYYLARPETTAGQFPNIPSAAFLPGPQEIHYSQVFRPTIPIQSVSNAFQ